MNLLKNIKSKLPKENFKTFLRQAFATVNPGVEYLHNWHIDLIADYLRACEKGEIKRLIINIPPRYLKSLIVNVAWPAWLLGHDPARRIISASYSNGLSVKHSLDCRLLITQPWYQKLFPKTKLTNDQNEKDKFITTKRGFRLATSTGGTLTGEGGNFLILDDPNNPAHVMSKTVRDETLRWYEQVFSTRLDDRNKGVIVIIMQRLHPEDLTGHLLEKQGVWEVLKLPAILDSNSKLVTGNLKNSSYQLPVTTCDQPLHPTRQSLEELNRTKAEMGSFAFAAQYMQNPLAVESGMIKQGWIQYYDASMLVFLDARVTPPQLAGEDEAIASGGGDMDLCSSQKTTSPSPGLSPHPSRKQEGLIPQTTLPTTIKSITQSWDTAIKTGKNNDYSVCTTWGQSQNGYYLLDLIRIKAEYPQLKRLILSEYQKWKPERILMEDKASGQSLIQELRAESKLPIIPVKVSTDKISRFASVTPLFEAGKIFFPKQAHYLPDLEVELFSFPECAHDDQVDSISQYLNRIRGEQLFKPNIRRF